MYNKLVTEGIHPRLKVFNMFIWKYVSKTDTQKSYKSYGKKKGGRGDGEKKCFIQKKFFSSQTFRLVPGRQEL